MLPTILVSIVLIKGSLTSVAVAGPKQRDGIVHGAVMVAPTCPGPELLDRRNCLPRPQQATVRVLQGEGDRPVTAITTDRSGRFRLTLPPGTYRLVPMIPGGVSIGKPCEARVTAGSTISIQLTIDTGIELIMEGVALISLALAAKSTDPASGAGAAAIPPRLRLSDASGGARPSV